MNIAYIPSPTYSALLATGLKEFIKKWSLEEKRVNSKKSKKGTEKLK